MTKRNEVISNIFLAILLLLVPVVVMALMGFDQYDADEFRIISVAVLADVVVFLAYKFFQRRLFGQS